MALGQALRLAHDVFMKVVHMYEDMYGLILAFLFVVLQYDSP